jgi:16S rRNA (uracil1498-N3)-methyltransferase
MHIPRIYYSGELILNIPIELDATASHHLVTVLRLQQGDTVCLFNGLGGEFIGKLGEFSKRRAQIILHEFVAVCNESPLAIHLLQGISRGEKMDFTLQKAVELGVSEITPVFTEYCNVHLAAERLEKRWQHWQTIVIQACEQSGRQKIPHISRPLTLSAGLSLCQTELRLVLTPQASQHLYQLPNNNKPQSIAILVGPEGGLSPAELQLAQHNSFQTLRLGPRILRTETAALVALSCIQAQWGDLG